MTAPDWYDLSGQTALVTGVRRGIGRAAAVALAEAGADIVGVSASLPEDGGEVAALVRSLGRSFAAYPCDLSDRQALRALTRRLEDEGRRIDILVNNAGLIRRAPAAEHSDEDWDAVLDVNLTAAFLLTREIGRGMVARGHGKVIFVASVLSFQGGLFVPGYAASKGGIAQLTKSFANEWASSGVNVNAIAPGYIATDNTQALRDDAERTDKLMARVPVGRWGNPEEIGRPIAFLASKAAAFMHGSIMTVDGGWLSN